MKSFLDYFTTKTILLNILHNVAIYLFTLFTFYFAHYGNSSKLYISIKQEKTNFLVEHNYTKWFSGTRVTQRVNVSSLQFVIFGSVINNACKNFVR